MMPQSPLDLAALNADARLAHHLCLLADPHDQDELDAHRLGVVGKLDAHVGVLRFARLEVRRELGEAARAGRGEGQGRGGGGGVGSGWGRRGVRRVWLV